jgi:hypothetical protein
MAAALTLDYIAQPLCEAPAQVLCPQLFATVERYLREKVRPAKLAEILG